MMLLVVAGRFDTSARALVERLRALGARLVTSEDLSTLGWRYFVGDAGQARVVVEREIVDPAAITGALVLVPAVSPHELVGVMPDDRAYVAAEMTAFLTAWLLSARFPVINRPTPACLMGPAWRREEWMHAAARLGIPARTKLRVARPRPEDDTADHASVMVVVDRAFGEVHGRLAAHARRLAEHASVELLTVQFSGPEADAVLTGAFLGVDVSRPEVADAILERLSRLPAIAE